MPPEETAALVPYSVLEPEGDGDRWRYVDSKGITRPFGNKQLALVQHLGTHPCSVRDAADAVGMDYTGAIRALSLPHVKSLMLHVTDIRRVTLRAGAYAILESCLLEEGLDPAAKASLALRILARLGEGEDPQSGNTRAAAHGASGGINVNISLPHKKVDLGPGVTVGG